MTKSEKCDVIVIGAGIAGLTAALCLAKQGFHVTIFEKNKHLGEAGAGIQLTPNASRVLIGLGLESALARLAAKPEYVEIGLFSNSETLVKMRLNADTNDSPWFSLRRVDLQSILLKAVSLEPDISLKLGRSIELFTQTDRGIVLKCRNSNDMLSEYQASVLIGADGIWSNVRSIIFNGDKPSFTGYEAWRALLPIENVPPAYIDSKIRLRLGSNCHLVTYPVSNGKELNIVFVRKAHESRDVAGQKSWSYFGSTLELANYLNQTEPVVSALFAQVKKWQVWSLYDMPVADMASEHVALIGDAAHPILPFLAQGAALAIEDAAILADCLKQCGQDYALGLQHFSNLRLKRNKKVSRTARRNGRIYHLGWPLSLVRDWLIKRLGANGMARQYKWLYGWKP